MPDFASATIVTPALGLLLTTCILTAAPAKEEDPARRAQATLQRVYKLPVDHQRVWLRLIEQRYGWAVLLTLKPEDARREQARVAQILHQKTVAWNDLIALLRQLDQREKAAIARLVREYRSDVYDTFRKRPHDLVDRQDAWFRIWSLWEKAGSPPEQQDRLMDWLADAIKVSAKDAIGPLPPDPKFGADVQLVPEQLVRQLTQPPAGKPPADDFLWRPELQARSPLPVRIPDPSLAIAPAKQPPAPIVVRPTESLLPLSLLAETPPAIVPPLHVFPPVIADDPLQLTMPPPPPHYAVVVAVKHEALPVSDRSAEMVARAGPGDANPPALGTPQGRIENPSYNRRQPAELPSRPVGSPLPEQPVAVLTPVGGPASIAAGPRAISPPERAATEAEPPSGPPSQHELVAQLPRKPADFALPQPQRLEEYRVERQAIAPNTAAAEFQPPPPPAAQADQHAQVNVEELGTRIAGINLSLRNLESELNEKRDFSADQLDSLLSRLDILVLRQKDLALFRDLISPQEKAKVGQIDSSRSIVANMGNRIAELRTRIRGNEALPELERAAALKQLDELSDRLATLTAEK